MKLVSRVRELFGETDEGLLIVRTSVVETETVDTGLAKIDSSVNLLHTNLVQLFEVVLDHDLVVVKRNLENNNIRGKGDTRLHHHENIIRELDTLVILCVNLADDVAALGKVFVSECFGNSEILRCLRKRRSNRSRHL